MAEGWFSAWPRRTRRIRPTRIEVFRQTEVQMLKAPAHKWTFRARFRRHAFGWKSQPAIKRIKEAVTEIKKVARQDRLLGAEGEALFLEKVSTKRRTRATGSSPIKPGRISRGSGRW